MRLRILLPAIIVVAPVLSFAVAAPEAARGAERPAGIKVGDTVPDFSVRTLAGKTAKLSDLRKDPRLTSSGIVVLSFWCSTCHSCRHVESHLSKLAKDYAGKAAVLALDANANDDPQAAAAFARSKALAMSIVFDPAGHTADLFACDKTTTTLVIDAAGVLRYRGQFRRRDGDGSAEDALKAVLAGKEVAVKSTPLRG